MPKVSPLLNRMNTWLRGAGALALTAMMLLTVADVTGRFFKHPIFGSVELVGFLAVVVMGAAMPYTYQKDGHVGVEILLRLLPKKSRLMVEILTRCMSLVLFIVIAWQMFVYAADLRVSGEVSMNLELPVYLVVYVLAFCLVAFALTILQRIVDLVKQFVKEFVKQSRNPV